MIEEVNRLLFVAHAPERADLALVFGYSDPEGAARRARHGARLHREGHVPRLLFTGGAASSPGEPSEAERMAAVAVAAGVPASAILVEARSRTTFENVRHSLALLGEKGLLPGLSAVLLVSCPWHMGRVLRLARQAFPAHVRLLCCPQTEDCCRERWHEGPECRQRVLAEAELLRALIASGLLPEEC
jgi:uncharacterized SAM-binding protein YcdF (DUF218 family)